MSNSKQNKSTQNIQKKDNAINTFLENSEVVLRKGQHYYNTTKSLLDNTPIQLKIANIVIPFSLTFIFSYFYYNLPLSIIFAILTFLVAFLLSKMIAIIFIILYAVSISNIIAQRNNIIGKPFQETDIIKYKKPFNCTQNGLVIQSSRMLKELNGGYFTYSFWLYINNNPLLNNGATWDTYRNNEWKSVFYRGNSIENGGDLSSLIQFPGVWLTPVLNNIVIVFQNGSFVERLEINDIALNTWTNITIVVETKSVSIYINGLLDRTLNLYQNITLMNGYNLYVSNDKLISKNKDQYGFPGSLAELIYFNYALSPTDINNTYLYYKKIIDSYKYNKNNNNYDYNIPKLINNKDNINKS
jgi:hypothetical protein